MITGSNPGEGEEGLIQPLALTTPRHVPVPTSFPLTSPTPSPFLPD